VTDFGSVETPFCLGSVEVEGADSGSGAEFEGGAAW